MKVIELLLLLLVTYVSANWTEPIYLQTFRRAKVWGVYRDPALDITHALVSGYPNGMYVYYALSNSGTILYTTHFNPINGIEPSAALRVDGKHLILAFNNLVNVLYCESTDGGRKWSSFNEVTNESSWQFLSDMVYVAETGQLLIFFQTFVGGIPTIRVVSRAPGSRSFSREVTAGPGDTGLRNYESAGYSMYLSRCYLHLVYVHYLSRALMYVRSSDGAKTWSQPLVLDSTRVAIAHNVVTKENYVYIAYSEVVKEYRTTAKLIYSADYGVTFSSPIPMSTSVSVTIFQRMLALCKTTTGYPTNIMLSMIPLAKGIEYLVWNTDSMKYYVSSTSLNRGPKYADTGLDCVVDEEKSVRRVSALNAGSGFSKETKVFVAFETESILNGTLVADAE